MTRALHAVAAAFALGASLFVMGCSSCGKRNDEPTRDPKFDPTSDAAPRPSASASPNVPAGMTPAEAREFRTRIDTELCNTALERVNKLHSRPPNDQTLLNLVSGCLKYGNNAWYTCILRAETGEAADTCSRRFLRPPDEGK